MKPIYQDREWIRSFPFIALLCVGTNVYPENEAGLPEHELAPFRVHAARGPQAVDFAHLGIHSPVEPFTTRFADSFDALPGLIIQDSFGGIEPPRITVRGSGLQSAPVSRGLALAYNSFPLNYADGSFNLSLLETAWIEQAGLVSGPAAGAPQLGGSLNVWSSAALTRGYNKAGSMVGSHQTYALATEGSASGYDLTPAWGWALTRSDGWRNHSEQKRDSGLLALRSAANQSREWTIQAYGTHARFEVPGPLTKVDAFEQSESNNPAVRRDRPRRDTRFLQLAGRFTVYQHNGYHSFGGSFHTHRDHFYQLLPNGISQRSGEDWNLFLDGRKEWESALTQRTDYTLLLQTASWDANRFRTAEGTRGSQIGNHQLRPMSFSATLDHRIHFPASHSLEIGASLLAARRRSNDQDADTDERATEHILSRSKWAPRASWAWQFHPSTRLVLGWSRTYEAPTYEDLFFTAGPMAERVLRSQSLDWQRADSLEIALHGSNDRLQWTLSAYHAPWRRELLRLVDESGSPRGTVHAGRTLHSGLEASAQIRLYHSERVQHRLRLTWQSAFARFDGDTVYGNNRLAGLPPHSALITLEHEWATGWFLQSRMKLQTGRTYADHANQLYYGGSTLCSIEVGRRFADGWKVSLGILNLFDRRSIASTAGVLDQAANPDNTLIFLPASGRRFELRADYVW